MGHEEAVNEVKKVSRPSALSMKAAMSTKTRRIGKTSRGSRLKLEAFAKQEEVYVPSTRSE